MREKNWQDSVIAAIVLILVSEICLGSDEGDFQYWSKVSLCFNINKDWQFEFEEEFKLGDHAEQLFIHNSDFGFVYSGLAGWLDLGFKFKKEYEKEDDGSWTEENRPHFNVTITSRLLGLDISDRSRLEYRDLQEEKDLWRYRNKLTVRLPLELTQFKLQPYMAEEVFINFDAEDFNTNRLYGGFYLWLSKKTRLDVYYLWQVSKDDGNWDNTHVLGTNLGFYF